MRAARLSGLLLATGLAGLAGSDAGARQRAETSLLLRAKSTAALEALGAGGMSSYPGHARRHAVTDLVVRLKPWGDVPLAAALDQAAGGRPGRGQVQFAAELIVVAAGRLQIEERAACGPWTGDTALCRAECDGGAFTLTRPAARGMPGWSLGIGKIDAITDAGFGDIVRLGACSDEVVPGGLAVRAGAVAAEVQLEAQ